MTTTSVCTSFVLLILSIDRHLSLLHLIPITEITLIAQLREYNNQEINYFYRGTRSKPLTAIIEVLSGGPFDENWRNPDSILEPFILKDSFDATNQQIVEIINISMPMN